MRKGTTRKPKPDWKNFAIEYLSIYTLTIIATILIQVVILKVDIEILLICILKSMFTNMISAALVMLGLRTQIIRRHILLMALVYSLSNISYIDMIIVSKYDESLTIYQIFSSYFIVYFILGFFIDRYVNLFKKILNKILNNGSQQ